MIISACLVLSGCAEVIPGSRVTPDSEYYDTYKRGLVDVVCLQGMNAERGEQDTLFGCLLAARDKGLGTVDLPKGVYLGHVSEFIVRSLKFYRIEENFERFYGCRIVLRFREAGVMERKENELSDYSGMILGTAGEMAVAGTGLVSVPLTPVIFAFKAVSLEVEREEIAEQAREQGLPEPDRGGGVVAWRDIRDTYGKLVGMAGNAAGMGGDAVLETYVVEECYLAKPDMGQVLYIAGRMAETAPPARTGRP